MFQVKPINKKLRFMSAIISEAERKWLRESDHECAQQFRRLQFMLNKIPGDENIEVIVAHHLLDVVSSRLAYNV